MNDSNAATRRMSRFGLALVVLTLPACHSAGYWARHPEAAPDHVAYKPVATSWRGRPFYVSGYGGADYSPSRPRRVQAVDGGMPAYVVPAPADSAPAVSVRQGTWDEP